MRLMTFGCSLTKICGVTDFFRSQAELMDFSESAGSNQLQIQRYHDFTAVNTIPSDTTLLYQITALDRPWARLSRSDFEANSELYVPELPPHNYCHVENHDTVDLLCNARYDHVNPVMISLQDLLDHLNELNQRHPLIVWFGHQGFLQGHHVEILQYLKLNSIIFCKEFFTQWCWDNRLPFNVGIHPAVSSGFAYAQQCLLPLIKQVMHR